MLGASCCLCVIVAGLNRTHGEAALTLPLHFKRHCEESIDLLASTLKSIFRLQDIPEDRSGFVNDILQLSVEPLVRLQLGQQGRRCKTSFETQMLTAKCELTDIVCSVIEALSCIIQGLNAAETVITAEEINVVLPPISECIQVYSLHPLQLIYSTTSMIS